MSASAECFGLSLSADAFLIHVCHSYKSMHGKFVLHPFLDRRIPIITDGEAVDMTFGTVAVRDAGCCTQRGR